MTEEQYRTPPDAAGMARAERAIRTAGLIALLVTGVAAAAGWLLLPLVMAFPTGLPERLAFAALASVFVLAWVLAGVLMVSTARRFSPQDIGGSAAGPPSERLAIPRAFLQNTLEQAVLAVGLYVALTVLLSDAWLSLIVVHVLLFGAGRILFLRGYARGVRGRALGMTLTMLPTMLGYLLAIGLIVARAA